MSANWYCCTGCGSTDYPWHYVGCMGPKPVIAVAKDQQPLRPDRAAGAPAAPKEETT